MKFYKQKIGGNMQLKIEENNLIQFIAKSVEEKPTVINNNNKIDDFIFDINEYVPIDKKEFLDFESKLLKTKTATKK